MEAINELVEGKISSGTGRDSPENKFTVSFSNNAAQVTPDAGEDNDSISNDKDSVTIESGTGDDHIKSTGENNLIDAGSGNDTIENGDAMNNYGGDYATINAGSGNDYIYNIGSSVSIDAGDGNDTITNGDEFWYSGGNFSTIDAGAGNDYVSNIGSNVLISGGEGNDSIFNIGSKVTISSGAGNDSISNNGSQVSISSGTGNDKIENYGYSATINAGKGDDSIINNSYEILIQYRTGDGNDLIQGFNSNSTLQISAAIDSVTSKDTDIFLTIGQDTVTLKNIATLESLNIFDKDGNKIDVVSETNGNDFIHNQSSNVTINSAAGNDTIRNSGNSVTINAGDGNDSLNNNANNVLIDASNGNDYVQNGGYYSTIGSFSTIKGGTGDDHIVNFAPNVSINGEEGNDSIYNEAASVSIDGGDGADTIYSGGDSVTITGGTGNDSINASGTIYGDAGNDFISGSGYINGGADNDTIFVRAQSTINAGTGEDFISLSSSKNLIQYSTGDGNDSIQGFNANSSLQILSGTVDKAISNGNDIFLAIGQDTVTFKNVAELEDLNVVNLYGNKIPLDIKVEYSDSDNFIQNYRSGASIKLGAGNDTIYNWGQNSTIEGGEGDDSIFSGYDGADSFIDGGAGNDVINIHEGFNVKVHGGAGNDSIDSNGDQITVDGGAGNDTIINDWGSNVTITGGAGDDYIRSGGSNNFINSGEGNDTIVYSMPWWNDFPSVSLAGGAGNDLISITGYYTDETENGNFFVIYESGNDLIQGLNATSTLQISTSKIDSAFSDGKDILLTIGKDIVTLKNAAGLEKLNVVDQNGNKVDFEIQIKLSTTDGDDSIENSSSNILIELAAGNDTITNRGSKVTINGGSGNDKIFNEAESVSIAGETGNDSIRNSSARATIDGGDGNDSVTNSGSLAIISSGSGNDSIYNSGASSTLAGGSGNDFISNTGSNVLFQYSVGEGNDLIQGFNSTSTLQILSGKVDGASSNGEDIFLTVGQDTVTVKNAAALENFNVINEHGNKIVFDVRFKPNVTDGNDYIKNYLSQISLATHAGNDTVDNRGSSVSIDSGAGNDSIQNSGANVTIDGGADNDYISNSSSEVSINGGDGNDHINNNNYKNVSITGGTGDDRIYNSGASVFIDGGADNDYIRNYASDVSISGGEGNDLIENYGSNMKIVVDTGNDTIYNSGKNVTIDAGTGNDSINNSGSNVIFRYRAGDGSDIIEGFKTDSTLQISAEIDAVISKDTDLFLTVGQDTVTLKNVTALESLNIFDKDGNNIDVVSETDTNDYINTKRSNVTINAGAGNDNIILYGTSNSVSGGSGKDTIYNYGHSSTIDSGTDNDFIRNEAESVTINSGEGDDSILNNGSNVSISSGEGDDSIRNKASNVTINAGEGRDSIHNVSASVKISSGTGNDSIYNSFYASLTAIDAGDGKDSVHNESDSVKISSGAGNDWIYNRGSSVTIDGGDGHDSINNSCASVSIAGGDGGDSIYNGGSKVTITGGSDNDSISNSGSSISIDGGSGDDSIDNSGYYASISGGAGNDSIYNSNSYVTIDAGTGNDTIRNYGSNVLFRYRAGGGNDYIEGFKTGSTLQISAEIDSVISKDTDLFLTVGHDTVTLKNAATFESLNVVNELGERIDLVSETDGNDFIHNHSNNRTINAGKGDDSIRNTGASVSIDSGEGNDFISNSVSNVTIAGGEGDDSVKNTGASVSIASGEGNDSVFNSGSYVIISSDAGNDSVENTGLNVTIAGGEGDDSILNRASDVTIDGGAGNDSIDNRSASVSISGGAGDDSILNFGYSVKIHLGTGNDTINNSGSNVLFQYSDGDGNDLIQGLNSTSTLQILSGKVDGVSSDGKDIFLTIGQNIVTLKNAATFESLNVVNELGERIDLVSETDGNDFIYNRSKNREINAGAGDDSIRNTGASVSIDSGDGNDFVFNTGSYGSITGGTGDDSIKNKGSRVTIEGGAGNDSIDNSYESSYTSLNGGAGNDSIYDSGYNNTIIGGAGDDSIKNSGSNNVILYSAGDGNDLIQGLNSTSTLQILSGKVDGVSSDGKDIFLTIGENTVTLKKAVTLENLNVVNELGERIDLVSETDGNDFIHNHSNNRTINAGVGNDFISNSGSNVTIAGGAGDDSIKNTGASVSIDSGAGNDTINNIGSNVSITSGDGNDSVKNIAASVSIDSGDGNDSISNSGSNVTIAGGAGDDSITSSDYSASVTIDAGGGNDSISLSSSSVSVDAGAGNDTINNSGSNVLFKYQAGDGNDSIQGFNENSTLQILSDKAVEASSDGKDIFLTIGENTVTLKNAATLESLNVVNELGEKINLVNETDGNDFIHNHSNNRTINAGVGNDFISNSGSNVTIAGGAGDDSIKNFGSDVLFQYNAGDGNDLIQGFNSTSTLQILSGKVDGVSSDGTDIFLTIGQDTVTLENAADLKTISIVDKDGSRIKQVTSADGNIYIDNSEDNATIESETGNNLICNTAVNVLIRHSSGNTCIMGFNESSTLQISAENVDNAECADNDVHLTIGQDVVTLKNGADLDKLNITDPNGNKIEVEIKNIPGQCINLNGSGKTVITGNGDDTVYATSNSNNGNYIGTRGGNDQVSNNGTNTTIDGGSGNDHISTCSNARKNLIYGGKGNDVINANGAYSTIDGGDNNDNISASSRSLVKGGDGSDTISAGEGSTIDGGKGNDNISASSRSLVKGGDDSDTISAGEGSTIDAGNGHDLINLHNVSKVSIKLGDGSDTVNVSSYNFSFSVEDFSKGDIIQFQKPIEDVETISGGIVVKFDANNKVTINGIDYLSLDNWWFNKNNHVADYDHNTTPGSAKVSKDKEAIVAFGDKDLVKFSGVGLTDGMEPDGKLIRLSDKNFAADKINVLSNKGGYSFALVDYSFDTPFTLMDDDLTDRTFTKKTFVSTDDADTISISGLSSTVKTGAGDDSIYNKGLNISIVSGDNNDTIENFGAGATLESGAGDDSIYNAMEGSESKIDGGADKDTIINGGDSVTIDSGSEDDTVENTGCNVTIVGGGGNDSIKNLEGNDSEIKGGDGNNTIKNGIYEGHTERIYLAYGTYTEKFVIDEDTKGGNNVTINGGENEDFIQNYNGSKVTINAGNGDDKIINSGGSNVSINAGGGEKNLVSVTSSSSKVTIEGGDETGADLIYNDSDNALIKGNAGYDLIENKGSYANILGGVDNDLLTNYGDHANIYGEGGEDYIYSDKATDVIIDGGADADDIYAYHDIRAKVLGGDGDDRIFMNRVSASTKATLLKKFEVTTLNMLYSLAGIPIVIDKDGNGLSKDWKDWLGSLTGVLLGLDDNLFVPKNVSNSLKIPKNAGGAWISAVSGILSVFDYANVLSEINNAVSTVNGGKGDDTIVLDGFAPRVIEYKNGDGNDTIYYLATNQASEERNNQTTAATHLSTLDLRTTKITDVEIEDNDVILKIGTGSVKLVDAAGFRFKVREADGTLTTRIYGTNGNDNLYMNEKDNGGIICGNGGNDTISNGYGTSYSYMFGDNTTIDGGAGNDHIDNYGKFASISGGADDDTIILSNKGSSSTVNGGKGNDIIYADFVSNVLVEYTDGDGNDIVNGFNADDTLKISALSYTLERKGFDLIVHVGNGSINLKGCRLLSALGKVNIDGTPENELVNLEFYDMQLDGDKLSLLKLNPDEVLDMSDAPNEIRIIDASKSKTSVKVIGNSSVNEFKGSDKADVYYSEPPSSGNSSNNDIASSAGLAASDDLVSYSSIAEIKVMSICAGGGDDTIFGGNGTNLYVYRAGDGNDLIKGFNASSTLSISGSEYSSAKSGKDVIITVGEENVTLAGAATLSTVNIAGNKTAKLNWTLNGTTAIYGTQKDTLLTVTGVKSLDGLSLKDKVLIISASALNKSPVTISDGYTLALGNDVTQPTMRSAYFDGLTYKTATISEGYTAAGNKITYSAPSGGKSLFTLSGVKNTTGVTVDTSKKIVTLSADSLDKKNIAVDGDYKLALSGVSAPTQTKAAGFDGLTYKNASISEGYTAAGNKITYSAPSGGNSLFTLNGVKNTTGVTVDTSKKIVTLTANNLDKKNVTVDGDYKLALSGVSAPSQTKAAGFDGLTYKTASISEGYTAAGNKITYSAPSGGKSLFTLSGVKNTTGVTVDTSKKIVTLTANNLDKKNITVDGDYKLALSGVSAPAQTKAAGFDGLTYKTAAISEGYTAAGNKITYSAPSGGKSLFTLSGVKNTTGVTVDTSKKIVTLSADSLDKKNIAVDGNYKLALSGVSAPAQTKAAGFDGTTYKTATISEGYTAAGNKITYSAASGGNSLFTLSGVKNTTGVTVDTAKKIVTLTANNLDKKNVTVDGNYKLALSGVSAPSQTKAAGFDGLTYKNASISEGYTASGNKITYSAASGGNSLFTLSGVKNATGVTVDTSKKIVTLTANNLDKKNVTVDGNYKLALSGVSAPAQTKAAGFDGLTYKTATISEGYTTAGNKITYSAASGGKSLFTLSGVKNATGVTVDTSKKIVTLTANNLDKKNVTVDGDYKLALSGVSAPSQTKAAGFDGTTYKTATISEGYTASGNKITYSAPSGGKSLFTLSGVKNTTGVTVDTSKKIVTLTANNLDKKNVTVDGDYKLALSGVSAPTQTKAAGFDGLTYKTATISEGYTAAGNKITYSAPSGGKSLFTLSGVKNATGVTVDTSKKIVTLTANNLDKKNVTVDGNYKLALSGVSAPSQTKAAGFDGTTYKTASISEGYTAAGNKITYSAPSGGKSLFTLSGVKNTTGVTVDTSKKIVTLTANNLDKKNVTVDGDYKLALSGVSAPTQTKAAGFDGLTYKTATISEGYTASGNKITYSAASGGNSLFTLSGVKNTTGVTVDTTKKIVTLSAGNLGKKNVTVDGSYKLKLASDVDTTQEDINEWTTLKGSNVAYIAGGKGEYYSASSNKVTYTASVAGANKFELSGAKGTPKISGGTVKLTAGNFKSNVAVASNAGGYKVSLSGNFKGKSFTGTSGVDLVINVGKNISLIGGAGNDKIANSGKNVTISGGKGNDKITLGGGNVFCYATDDGNDTLYNFSSTDKIKLRDTSKATSTINGKDVVFTTDGGKITVKNAAQGTAVKVVNSKDKVISNYTYTADGIADGKSITLKSDFSGTFKAKNYTNVDGSKVAKTIKIIGGASASTLKGGAKSDSIVGGKGKDSLIGGKGNDSLAGGAGADILRGGKGNDSLWGGAGNDSLYGGAGSDTFIYKAGEGSDKIFDYQSGDMLTILKANGKAGSFTKSKFSGGTLSLTIKGGGSVIFDGVAKGDTFNINNKSYMISGKKLK